MTVTLTPEVLADLRKRAEAVRDRNAQPGEDAAHVVEVDPLDMLALLDRIEALEAFLGRIHGQTDPAVMNQAIWRFLHPTPPASSLSDPDPDE